MHFNRTDQTRLNLHATLTIEPVGDIRKTSCTTVHTVHYDRFTSTTLIYTELEHAQLELIDY